MVSQIKALNLSEILQDIHGLNGKLQTLEKQYGILSEDFYTLYRLGEIEQSHDAIRWVGYYELRQERQEAYQTALRKRLLALRQTYTQSPIPLQPVFTA